MKKVRCFRRSDPANPESWPDYSAENLAIPSGNYIDLRKKVFLLPLSFVGSTGQLCAENGFDH